jgi:hypothetical protein
VYGLHYDYLKIKKLTSKGYGLTKEQSLAELLKQNLGHTLNI